MIDQVYSQVERVRTIVRGLLDFARRDTPTTVVTPLHDILESTARLVPNECRLAGVDLELRTKAGLHKVKGNVHNLQQVFLNLFIDAVQAMPNGGRLTVSIGELDGGFVEVDVTDTGIGIPSDVLDKAFDLLFTTKEPGTGTGLGLTVSRAIVEKHGGDILVRSEVGKGTTFAVRLPVVRDQPQEGQ